MQKKKMKWAVITALIAFNTLSSCQKAETGPQGAQGIAGKDGNADVTSTNSVTISPNQWGFNGYTYTVQINTPGITQDILNSGVAMVYMSGTTNEWVALPYIEYYTYFEYILRSGSITLAVSTVNEESPEITIPLTFRIVIIPSSQRKANPEVNYLDYQQVIPMVDNSNTIKAYVK